MATVTRRALVIGGTGMLADATRILATLSEVILLAGRNAGSFARQEGSQFVPVDLDWNDERFRTVLEGALAREGQMDRALLWLHQPERMLPWLLPLLANAHTVLVLGSVHSAVVALPQNVVSVRLGSKATHDGRRWLTNEKISAGAIEALRSGRDVIVGEIHKA
jgi:hypothetical protein